jgi:hypothetical protein
MMIDIVEKLRSMKSFHALSGAPHSEIDLAESALKLKFANEYKDYVAELSVASVFGHEFTGICKFPRLNVVDVTLSERAANPTVPMDWYVVEQAHIDGIVVWQSVTGDIYQTIPGAEPTRLCDSFSAYLNL